jgi:hypothetical protein
MEKSIFGATDKLRSLIQNQPRGHFRSACRQIRTLLEVGLSIMADTPREQSTAGRAIGGFKRIMQLPGIFTHALAVMVRLLVSYQQAAAKTAPLKAPQIQPLSPSAMLNGAASSNGLSVECHSGRRQKPCSRSRQPPRCTATAGYDKDFSAFLIRAINASA